jgi:dephospho-CoA kinase
MVVGLTGGIGSGKSTVAKLFEVLGVPVYNSDIRAKEMYYKPEVKEQVKRLLGTNAYDESGKLNVAHISKTIFGDSGVLQKVNGIIHPAVENDFKEFIQKHSKSKLILKESALIFEAGIYKKLDKTILVTSPLELRMARVQARDKITADEVIKRINHQLPDEEKGPISDFIIKNDEKTGLIPQVLDVFEKLKHA